MYTLQEAQGELELLGLASIVANFLTNVICMPPYQSVFLTRETLSA